MTRTGRITQNFTWEEARCRCGCEMPEEIAAQVILTADMMERVRALLGNKPLHVASWYRCPAHHRALYAPVPAPMNSQHLFGRGVDFSQKGRAPSDIQAQIRQALWPAPVRGLELDPGHTHIDRRPEQPIVFLPNGTVIEKR